MSKELKILIVCEQLNGLLDECKEIIDDKPEEKLSNHVRSIKSKLNYILIIIEKLYPYNLRDDDDEIDEKSVDNFVENNSMKLGELLYDQFKQKLTLKFMKNLVKRNEEYFVEALNDILKGTYAEGLSDTFGALIKDPIFTVEDKNKIWDWLEPICKIIYFDTLDISSCKI